MKIIFRGNLIDYKLLKAIYLKSAEGKYQIVFHFSDTEKLTWNITPDEFDNFMKGLVDSISNSFDGFYQWSGIKNN